MRYIIQVGKSEKTKYSLLCCLYQCKQYYSSAIQPMTKKMKNMKHLSNIDKVPTMLFDFVVFKIYERGGKGTGG